MSDLRRYIDTYLSLGWSLTPLDPGTKKNTTPGWNLRENCIRKSDTLPENSGVGLMHAYSGTMALDIDNKEVACAELAKHGIDLEKWLTSRDAVRIVSGAVNHAKLLYLMPFGVSLQSKKLITTDSNGKKFNYLDFRCASRTGLTVQDVLPPTIHPETKKPYVWIADCRKLPIIPDELLQYWQSLIPTPTEPLSLKSCSVKRESIPWAIVESALYKINPDIDRDSWVRIGMALQVQGYETGDTDRALELWNAWSIGPNDNPAMKYPGYYGLQSQWEGFAPDAGITVGTLFHIAESYGWRRPQPSAENLFKDVELQHTLNDPVDLLEGLRPPSPSPDLSLWPKVLVTRAKEIAETRGCDPLVPLFTGLGVVCGAVDSRIRLEVAPEFEVPPILWIMTIGDPSDKKSPGSLPMIEPLRIIEKENRPQYQQNYLMWEALESQYKNEKSDFINHFTSTESELPNNVTPEVPMLPPPPVPLKLIVQDITSQKLVRNCADRPRGLLCHLDEMRAWVKKLTEKNTGEDRSSWIQGFESSSYCMERVGAGEIYAENMAVAIVGNIQPRVLSNTLESLCEDGLMQRFIPVLLRSKLTKKGNPIPKEFSTAGLWNSKIKELFVLSDNKYKLSTEAWTEYEVFQDWYYKTRTEERIIRADPDYLNAFGKLEGQVARLILVFHLIEDPLSLHVPPERVARVVQIAKTFLVPSLRYLYNEIGGKDTHTLDGWITSHVIALAGKQDTLSLRDLKRSARRKMTHILKYQQDQAIRDAMAPLEGWKWVEIVEDDPRKGRLVWKVNPRLAEMYTEYRKEVARIKEEQSHG